MDERPVVAPPDTEQDEPVEAHIVYPKNAITEAIVLGTPVTALCGYTWVPHRDPDTKPVCGLCVDEFEKVTGRRWPGRR